MIDNEPVLYIIMRNDMESLNPGKLSAQCGHAVSMFHQKMNSVKANSDLKSLFLEWLSDRDFGTKIVLGADKGQIDDICYSLKNKSNIANDIVYDPTYPFWTTEEIANILIEYNIATHNGNIKNKNHLLTRKELTCMYIFGDKNVISEYVIHLNLYP